MPSTRGFACRRSGVRDSRLPPRAQRGEYGRLGPTWRSVRAGEVARRLHHRHRTSGPYWEGLAACDVNGTPSNDIEGGPARRDQGDW